MLIQVYRASQDPLHWIIADDHKGKGIWTFLTITVKTTSKEANFISAEFFKTSNDDSDDDDSNYKNEDWP